MEIMKQKKSFLKLLLVCRGIENKCLRWALEVEQLLQLALSWDTILQNFLRS